LQAKAKKHEVLDGEIKANAGQLKAINRTGHHMINRSDICTILMLTIIIKIGQVVTVSSVVTRYCVSS
jgi:hypothetical protein